MMNRIAVFICSLFCAGAVMAQDLMLFPADSYGKVVLPNNQSAIGSIEFEAAVGSYNNEFVATYGAESIFAKTGRAVGRLDILTDKGHAPCTAFLVEGNRLITNHHCVPGILDNPDLGAKSILAVQFVAGYLQDGITEGTKKFHINPVPLETNEDLDYSVLQVLGDANAEYGALRLASALPIDRAPFWVIGHPMGEAQRISREKCQASSPALSSNRLLHTCDTLPGNSGSPVIDAGLQEVIGLHHAGSRAGAVNFAIPMATILEASAILEASPPLAPANPVIDTSEVDAAIALATAIANTDLPARIAALEAVIAQYPNAKATRQVPNLLRLARAEMTAALAVPNPDVVETPVVPDSKPGSKPLGKPVEVPAVKPGSKPVSKPVEVTTVKPGSKPLGKPVEVAVPRPGSKPVNKPGLGSDTKALARKAVESGAGAENEIGKKFDTNTSARIRKAMSTNRHVQDCDRLAGIDTHPDYAAGHMQNRGVTMDRIRSQPAIAACTAALKAFPGQPRMLVFMGRAHEAAKNYSAALVLYHRASARLDPLGSYNLAEMYEAGRGVSAFPNFAATLYVASFRGGIDPDGKEWKGEMAKALQRELKELGLYRGSIDGIIGRGTRSALKKLATN